MSAALSPAERLRDIETRMGRACDRAARARDEVSLVGASKMQPIEVLQQSVEAGLRIFGENRVQEARDKAPLLPAKIDWHLLGPLQSNKARLAASLFSTVHSIDRPRIARVLDKEGQRASKKIQGFLEINLGDEPSKHGFSPNDLAEAARPLADTEFLRIVGLMAIPPFEEDLDRARAWFSRLRELRDQLFARTEWSSAQGWLSMGMSHDFETAIEEGATHIRVGTALFGSRPPRP